MAADETFTLNGIEMEVLKKAAGVRRMSYDPKRTTYTASELKKFGMVRESYTPAEMDAKGIPRDKVITCFDPIATQATSDLAVDAPFASGIKKWQLPINSLGIRMLTTVFPPNTVVQSHSHPRASDEDQGGGLRIVISGSITYDGRKYGPGDWFYIPNGIPYSFTTDPNEETKENYDYGYEGRGRNRFSSPIAE